MPVCGALPCRRRSGGGVGRHARADADGYAAQGDTAAQVQRPAPVMAVTGLPFIAERGKEEGWEKPQAWALGVVRRGVAACI